MNEREIRLTKDGSHTFYNNVVGETYHSTWGAIQESKHIFINAGLDFLSNTNEIKILEVGTGTGLNVLLSLLWAQKKNVSVKYWGVEPFPFKLEELELLNYTSILGLDYQLFKMVHTSNNDFNQLSKELKFRNYIGRIEDINLKQNYFDIIFFDAFSPDVQPELWDVKIFEKLNNLLLINGILTTYSCKGSVKRALKSANFQIEKLPGPPGKREFLRAIKR